jgi:DNA-binding transcriptional LysR family regulator
VYFEQCRQALSQLVDAERLVTGEQAAPAGLLRISMPTPYAHYRVLPLLPLFRKRYPQVQLDVHLSNRNIDFADEGYDLAIRGRAPDDSSLIARKLEDAELVLAATPSYLKRAGKPKTLEDLQKHECIQFELPSTGRRIPWTFQVDGKDARRRDARQLLLLGRRAGCCDPGAQRRGPGADLPLHPREGFEERRAGGGAAAVRRQLAALHPAVPACAPFVIARADLCGFPGRAAGDAGALNWLGSYSTLAPEAFTTSAMRL